ncbi:hypothetical protein COY20_00840 [Candidatus Shapirobacteria bacterium CG_4_10_14_0_2_um_filter_40_12]|uniref:Uncharacterized protein n=1 Tax=Candidatus Shapirobacteria bacterium CG_4_10_14_0_2_um_filter_40_12 TaxID=1974871 RepID=A0A2M7TTW7_9BACT|nr:MAG: hypothetical protein COY20_00840 [Candidatus Shapirobacteria bacterium CG_4_10_14_0_2_um_filter_40_12]
MSIREQVFEMPITARDLWWEITKDCLPDTRFTGTFYVPPTNHGVYPDNRDVIVSADDLSNIHPRIPEVFAIGAICYGEELTSIPMDDGEPDVNDLETLVSPYFTYQPELPGLKKLHIIPESTTSNFDHSLFCLVDFDCAIDHLNARRIINTLSKSRFGNWSLLDSGGSYHLVLDNRGFNAGQLIQTYAELIQLFSPDSSIVNRNVAELFAQDITLGSELIDIPFGDTMIRDQEMIRQACYRVLQDFRHPDTPNDGRPTFFLDIRFIAHAILQILKFYNGNTDSFGTLRITAGKNYSSPPVLIARSIEHQVALYKYSQAPFVRLQQRLPGF